MVYFINLYSFSLHISDVPIMRLGNKASNDTLTSRNDTVMYWDRHCIGIGKSHHITTREEKTKILFSYVIHQQCVGIGNALGQAENSLECCQNGLRTMQFFYLGVQSPLWL
jgi:hypothetical protein